MGRPNNFFSHSDEKKNQIGKAKKTTVDGYKRQKEQGNSSKAFVGRNMTLTVIFDQFANTLFHNTQSLIAKTENQS